MATRHSARLRARATGEREKEKEMAAMEEKGSEVDAPRVMATMTMHIDEKRLARARSTVTSMELLDVSFATDVWTLSIASASGRGSYCVHLSHTQHTCTCPDFSSNTGVYFCKHLLFAIERVARLNAEVLVPLDRLGSWEVLHAALCRALAPRLPPGGVPLELPIPEGTPPVVLALLSLAKPSSVTEAGFESKPKAGTGTGVIASEAEATGNPFGLPEMDWETVKQTGGVCVVCFEEFGYGERLPSTCRLLLRDRSSGGCSVAIHIGCAERWFKRTPTCVQCRRTWLLR